MGAERRPLSERLLEKVEHDPETGCWLWTASTEARGYAKIAVPGGKWERAHRVSYRLFVRPIPDGCEIHHECGVKRCVNPAHLTAVTRLDHRAVTPLAGFTRENALKSQCKRGHPLDGANVYLKNGSRHCRTCRRDAAREAYRARTGSPGRPPK